MVNRKEQIKEFIENNKEDLDNIKNVLQSEQDLAKMTEDPVFHKDIDDEYEDKVYSDIFRFVCNNGLFEPNLVAEVLEDFNWENE